MAYTLTGPIRPKYLSLASSGTIWTSIPLYTAFFGWLVLGEKRTATEDCAECASTLHSCCFGIGLNAPYQLRSPTRFILDKHRTHLST